MPCQRLTQQPLSRVTLCCNLELSGNEVTFLAPWLVLSGQSGSEAALGDTHSELDSHENSLH